MTTRPQAHVVAPAPMGLGPGATPPLTRTIRVGALTLRATTDDPRLLGPLRDAAGGYVGPAPEDVEQRIVADVALDLEGAAEHVAAPPRLRPLGAGVWTDDSEGWRARVENLAPDTERVSVRAHLRPLVDDPRQLRAIIDGFLRVVAATLAPLVDAVLVHGAALRSPDRARAIAFVGRSGDGKTTMTGRLPGWEVLSDDTVWIAHEGDRFVARGTPFRGKEGLARSGAGAPLERIVLLRPHADALALTDVPVADAFFALSQRLMWFAAGDLTGRALDLLGRLAERVPAERLASSLDHDVAPLFADPRGGR